MKVERDTSMATKEPTENKVPLPVNRWIGVEGGVRIYRSFHHCPSCGSWNTQGNQLTPVMSWEETYSEQESEYWSASVRCDSCGVTWKEVRFVTYTNIEP